MRILTILATAALGLLAMATNPVAAEDAEPQASPAQASALLVEYAEGGGSDDSSKEQVETGGGAPTDFFIACKEWISVDDDYCNLAVGIVTAACFHAFWSMPPVLVLCLLLAVT